MYCMHLIPMYYMYCCWEVLLFSRYTSRIRDFSSFHRRRLPTSYFVLSFSRVKTIHSCSAGGDLPTWRVSSVTIASACIIAVAHIYLSSTFVFLYVIFQTKIGFAKRVTNGTSTEILCVGTSETNAARCPSTSATFATRFFSIGTTCAATRWANTKRWSDVLYVLPYPACTNTSWRLEYLFCFINNFICYLLY